MIQLTHDLAQQPIGTDTIERNKIVGRLFVRHSVTAEQQTSALGLGYQALPVANDAITLNNRLYLGKKVIRSA